MCGPRNVWSYHAVVDAGWMQIHSSSIKCLDRLKKIKVICKNLTISLFLMF